MVWCSGWKLASSVSNSGGLGLIGAGSMHPEVLSEHIRQCRAATSLPFGVNIPLMYPNVEEIMHLVVREQVPVVFTSAGNPATWTPFLRSHGILVAHVVSNTRFAVKAAAAGVHALVAEGFEAGGHNGREETTTMVLLPLIRSAVDLPLMAAGGIASGEAILAAQALGADGVQIGSLFASTTESSAHPHFKQRITEAAEGDTLLMLRPLLR
jgi:enoyl-[acyl-carrier protein] reductase II